MAEQRIDMINCQLLQDELIHLQRDMVTGKCDHLVGGCFVPETKILMSDGACISIKTLINSIKRFTYTVPTVNEKTGEIEHKRILKVFPTKKVKNIYQVTLNTGDIIQCTPDHRFMLEDNTYQEVQAIAIGDKLKSISDKRVIVAAEKIPYNGWVYDLEIEDNHNFCLDAGVFVHNSKDVSDSMAGWVWNAIQKNPGVPVSLKAKAAAIALVNGNRSGPKSDPILGRFGNYKKY